MIFGLYKIGAKIIFRLYKIGAKIILGLSKNRCQNNIWAL